MSCATIQPQSANSNIDCRMNSLFHPRDQNTTFNGTMLTRDRRMPPSPTSQSSNEIERTMFTRSPPFTQSKNMARRRKNQLNQQIEIYQNMSLNMKSTQRLKNSFNLSSKESKAFKSIDP